MTVQLDELFLSEGKLELAEEDNLIWKTVLRTGQWAVSPNMAAQRKPLVVIRDGKSDIGNNIISMSEIIEAFKDDAYEHVTVPLASNLLEGDHADIARNNTGFIRDLKIVDEDGVSKLKAAFDFTEPDIKERVQRGTIPNTSVGLRYNWIRKSDAKKFPVALAHVALTHRPWIDKMEPFGMQASDDEQAEIASFEPVEQVDEKIWSDEEGFEYLREKAQAALATEFKLPEEFTVTDVSPGKIKIKNQLADIEWVTTYTLDEDAIKIPPANEWNLTATKTVDAEVETSENNEEEVVEETPEEPVVEEKSPVLVIDPTDDLQEAIALREARFAQGNNYRKDINMSERTDLNGLNLSDLPDEVRAAVEAVQERNRKLEREARKATVENQIKEWGDELGLSAAPGFLKEARRIMLSDDGNVAGILLADDDHKSEEKVTATEIVERLVNALPKTDEGKIQLSAQVELTADNEKPPVNDLDETPLETRLRSAREALGKPVE